MKDTQKEKKIKQIALTKAEFFRTTPHNLHNLTRDESIFTRRFRELLKEKLGKPDDFTKLNAGGRKAIFENVQNLLITETTWKGLTQKSKYEEHIILTMFGAEFEQFRDLFTDLFFPHGKKLYHKQVLQKFASYKCSIFYKSFLLFVQEKKVPFSTEINLENLNIDYDALVRDIEPAFFFKDLVKISMKKAFDQSINIEGKNEKSYYSRNLDNAFLYVPRTTLLYSIQEVTAISLADQALTAMENACGKRTIWSTPDKKIRFVYEFLKEHKKELMSGSCVWYRDTYSIAKVVIDFFENTDVVSSVEILPDKQGDKQNAILWLTHAMKNTVPFSHHLPRIIPPTKIDRDTHIDHYVNPLVKGVSTASISDYARKTLNISQKKKMKVNMVYLDIMDSLHNTPNRFQRLSGCTTKTPFPTIEDRILKEEAYQKIVKARPLSALKRYINRRANSWLAPNYKEKNDSLLIMASLKIANVTRIERDLNLKQKKLDTELKGLRAKRQLLQTSLSLAEVYGGFPVYYGTKLDYRTRMYPWEYLLSRTSGELKHLLMDYDERVLTLEGALHLMTAYFRFSYKNTLLLRAFLKGERRGGDLTFAALRGFFQRLKAEDSEDVHGYYDFGDQLAYYYNIRTVLDSYFEFKNKRTGIMIEIDQKASGLMIFAKLLNIKSLADATNLTNKKPMDVYTFVMEHIRAYFDEGTYKVKESNKKQPFDKGRLLTFFESDRKLNKMILMRWSYSEGPRNRGLAIQEYFREVFDSECSDSEYLTIKAFSEQYDIFLEKIFPGLLKKKELLLRVLDVRVRNTQASGSGNAVQIKTLDGCVLSWDFKPTVSATFGYYNPVVGKHTSFRVNKESESETAFKQRRNVHKRSFFPNLVHSIDSAIMRIIIREIHRKTGYAVGHVHDCVLIHPNYVDVFYEVVRDIYTGDCLDNLADKLFFEPMKEGLADDYRTLITSIQQQFHELADDVHVSRDVFEPTFAYSMEGSVNEPILWDYERQIDLLESSGHDISRTESCDTCETKEDNSESTNKK